ncbi:MAG: hypothetical protein RRC07_00875 [Anaerolineae bacterium]|nr:hypothetical protein [Anaerolineae bacterium]
MRNVFASPVRAGLLGLALLVAWLTACERTIQEPVAGTRAVLTTITAPALAEQAGSVTPDAYPPPGLGGTPAPSPYPGAPATPTPQPYPGASRTPASGLSPRMFLPAIVNPASTPAPSPTPTHTPQPTPTPTIDFRALRAEVRASGQELVTVKIGFHTGPGGNQTGIGEWMQRLDAAGVPFFLKSVDTTSALFEAQAIVRNSDLPHVLVYRTSGDEFDVPDYSLPPAQAARRHWEQAKAVFPPELDPSLVWLETINEVDKERAAWLGEFAVATARMALADGYRWAAFGWSSGEPEVSGWELPSMLEFLRLAGANPERLAVAVHEYSLATSDIAHDYPFKLGRFLSLFAVADRHGIPRPTVLITEWGWTYDDVPPVSEALEDIAWAARLYAPYPQVKGAALWYLGPGFGGIADQANALIKPLTEYALGTYFILPDPETPASVDPGQYHPFPPP